MATGASEVVQHFLSGRAKSTLKAYRTDLDAFAAFLAAESVEDAVSQVLVSPAHANLLAIRWLAQMRDDELSCSTRARRIRSLKSLISLARLLGIVNWHLEVRPPATDKYRDTRGTEFRDVKRLLKACGKGLLGKRDRALLLLAFTMGLRRAELANLSLCDYERGRRRILVRSRGGRTAWMLLPDETAHALNEWLCASRGIACSPRDLVDLDCHVPIFFRLDHGLSDADSAMTPDGVYVAIRRIGSRAGIRVHPQALRNSAITMALEETDGDIRSVQRFARYQESRHVIRYDDTRRDIAGSISETIAQLTDGETSDGK